jgi:hypothetical protein
MILPFGITHHDADRWGTCERDSLAALGTTPGVVDKQEFSEQV